MSGIYFHIPFCKTKCTYCDFFSKTDFNQKTRVLRAMLLEMERRENYLTDKNIATVYFGGGTPSILSIDDIKQLLEALKKHFILLPHAEITLEANPDDLSFEYLKSLRKIGINRLSMGIQSFDDEQLAFINRRHTSQTALHAVKNAQQAGFDNISIDLIYGLPLQTMESWKIQLEKAFTLNVQHISAYGLTYEKNTVLWEQRQQGKVTVADDELMIAMYEHLVEKCAENGFEQYEISNFAKNGFRSRHNSAYWTQTPYLGIGPSAHSYDGASRQWNIPSIITYCKNIEEEKPYFEREELTENDQYNDYVMVRLRTREGIDLEYIQHAFGEKTFNYLTKSAQKYLKNNLLKLTNKFFTLTRQGILLSNQVMEDLMKV